MKDMAYGYVRGDNGQKEKHAGEQKVIQAIHEYRAAGLSVDQIRHKLATYGFTLRDGGILDAQ